MKYRLSPSKLNIYKDCPRCFYLAVNKKLERVRGIFPSLPGGIDLVVKEYYDKYRKETILPPELDGKIDGVLFNDSALLNKWRSWKATNLSYADGLGNTLSGALDDCIISSSNLYAPLDVKTRGSAFREEPLFYAQKYYQLQLDCYTLMLNESGYKTSGVGYFVFYYPCKVSENGVIEFKTEVVNMPTSIDNAKKVFTEAVELLNSTTIPEASDLCEYCNFAMKRKEI